MKRDWNKLNIRDAYKPVPQAFEATVSKTIRDIKDMTERGKVNPRVSFNGRRMAIIVAVSVMLVGIAVAYAVTRPAILYWLLGDQSANEALEQSAQNVMGENSADHITVRINSLVYDGERFAFSYTLENDQPETPAMVMLDSHIKVNGQAEELTNTDSCTNEPKIVPDSRQDILPVRRNPTDGGGWSMPISQDLSGDVNCEITFIVYRPVKGFVVLSDPEDGIYHLSEYGDETQAEIQDSWNMLRSFNNVIITEITDSDPDKWSKDGYTVIDPSGMILNTDSYESTLYNMKETAHIPVTFHFNADAKSVYDFSGTTEVVLSDCTVRIHNIRFSPLTTLVDISLIPEENSKEAAQELVDRYGQIDLLDENEEPVQYSSMDYMDNSTPWVTEHWHDNKQWACTYLVEMPGLEVWPESISITTKNGELLRLRIDK